MAQPVKLTHAAYMHIRERLVADHGRRILISWVCKQELGFMFREHRRYDPSIESDDWKDVHTTWMVDFYDDAAETMFRLRYL